MTTHESAGDAKAANWQAAESIKDARNGLHTQRNPAFLGESTREEGKKRKNLMILRTIRTLCIHGLFYAPEAETSAPAAAAKHLDKGWTLHYKPSQGITG